MRITIEPTTDNNGAGICKEADCLHSKVIVEHPWDDLNIEHTMQLIRSALLAYGWSAESIEHYIPER